MVGQHTPIRSMVWHFARGAARLACVLLCLTLAGGCGEIGGGEPEEQPHLEGTPDDLKILRMEGIRNPDSEAGQARLRQLKRDREALEAILKEAEERNMRQRTDSNQ